VFRAAIDAKAVPSDAEPKSYREAMRCPDSELWHKPWCTIEAHLENGTWEPVKLPHGHKAIGSKWVFKVKRNPDGTVECYKAHLVAKGFGQRPGIDYNKTFAPTTKWAALRAIVPLATLENLELESIDISNTYLNGELHDVDMYMQQPNRFAKRESTWVARQLTGLYSLKQGHRKWFRSLEEVLVELSFVHFRSDPSVFIWKKDGVKVIVPVFVDNITLVSKLKEKIAEIKGLLAQLFKLHNLRPTLFLLGVQIDCERSARTLHLSQRQYTLDLLDCFGFADCSPVSTPLDPGLRLNMSHCPQTPEDNNFMRHKPYVSAGGALMYLAIATRPNIAHTVGVLCRFMSKPGPAHWKAAKHLFRYLCGSVNYCLTYAPDSSSLQLFTTYSDTDHSALESPPEFKLRKSLTASSHESPATVHKVPMDPSTSPTTTQLTHRAPSTPPPSSCTSFQHRPHLRAHRCARRRRIAVLGHEFKNCNKLIKLLKIHGRGARLAGLAARVRRALVGGGAARVRVGVTARVGRARVVDGAACAAAWALSVWRLATAAASGARG
jgi:hypothetical protein